MEENTSSLSGYRAHLSKDQRFPRIYKEVERILRDVKDNKGSVKNIIYSKKIPKRCFQKVYGLTYNVLKHKHIIQKIIEETGLLKKEPGLRQEAAEIMIHEMVLQKSSLPGQSKPVMIMYKYQTDIEEAFSKLQNSLESSKETNNFINSDTGLVSLPRYARVHTLTCSASDAIADLEQHGFEKVNYDSSISLDEYHNVVQSLEKLQFIVDYHFKDLLVFSNGENLSQWGMYQNGQIFLQDKTSYIPVHVLAPEPGSVVLDCCAAPGMKTAHLAAVMNNTGLIYAFDRDKERCKILKTTLKRANVSICKASCQDFTAVDPNVEPYSSVEYILLDPSCSGSGMVSRMDEVTDKADSKNINRLQQLARFQIVLLKHALSFPSVKRVVYSTCSIMEEENEYVIHEALNHYSRTFKIVPVFPEWQVRGSNDYEYGNLCLRAFPHKNQTNGFFVAMFERLQTIANYTEENHCNSVEKSFECDTEHNGKDSEIGCEKVRSKKKKRKHQ